MEPNSILTDSELISLLRDGDHSAYTELYKRYYYLMLVFSIKKLRDTDLAKDFVQELFTNLWYKREEISTSGNFSAFLYKSLRHRILDYFLHLKVESKYFTFLKDFGSSITCLHADHVIRENQLQAYIEKQIQLLPFKMRQIFELSRKEHLTHKEIAETLNTTEVNVTRHISNALKIMRTKLGMILFFI